MWSLICVIIFFNISAAVSVNRIPQQANSELVYVNTMAKHPGMKEESPMYVWKRKSIEKDSFANPIRHSQDIGKHKLSFDVLEPIDFMDNLITGQETFLDRIRGRVMRYKRRTVQDYR